MLNKKVKLALGCVGTAIVGFGSSFYLMGGQIPSQQNDVQKIAESSQNDMFSTPQKKHIKKIAESDFYMPQYKDKNNVCGIAINKDGHHVAVVSDGACPTNEALAVNYDYEYEKLADTFRPADDNGSCGTAHLVTQGARIGTKDMAKLKAMARGDLDNVGVTPKGILCPTQAELSDNISNSVGVPVRFEYNDFDINPNGYEALNVSESEFQQSVAGLSKEDMPIWKELSGTKVSSYNYMYIPKILLTPEAKRVCDGDFGNCLFSKEDMTLENVQSKKVYEVKTANGYVLPKFMMTRGAWDVCGGIFTQCDYTPDEEFPNARGTVTNRLTHKSYTSKLIGNIVDENDTPEEVGE